MKKLKRLWKGRIVFEGFKVSSLTKQGIKRIIEAPVDVSLWNGCFNRAVAKIKINRTEYELTVDVTHPELVWQCGDYNEIRLICWRTGRFETIPEELEPKIAEMKRLATMDDDYAKALSGRNKRDFYEGMKELGIV